MDTVSIYDDNCPFRNDLDEVYAIMCTAASKGDLRTIEMFVSQQADVNTPCQAKNNSTVLMCAAFAGQVEIVKYLLNSCQANPNIVNDHGESALSKAVMMGHYVVVDLLIKAGANTNIVLSNGETLFESAVNDGYKYTAFRLLCEMSVQQVLAFEQKAPRFATLISEFKKKIEHKQNDMLFILGGYSPVALASMPIEFKKYFLSQAHHASWYDHRKEYDATLACNKMQLIFSNRATAVAEKAAPAPAAPAPAFTQNPMSSPYQPDAMEIDVEEKAEPKKKDRSVLL